MSLTIPNVSVNSDPLVDAVPRQYFLVNYIAPEYSLVSAGSWLAVCWIIIWEWEVLCLFSDLGTHSVAQLRLELTIPQPREC